MSRRARVNKRASARSFRRSTSKTHVKNVRPGPMRGGIRL